MRAEIPAQSTNQTTHQDVGSPRKKTDGENTENMRFIQSE